MLPILICRLIERRKMMDLIKSWLLAISVVGFIIALVVLVFGLAFDVAALIISAVITIALSFVLAIVALLLCALEMLIDDIKDHKMR